jgi:quercetin dioxygenase-like cupin family protein
MMVMIQIRIDEVKSELASGGIFTGEVKIKRILGEHNGAKNLNISLVSFPSGIRNTWHSHDYDQCLWITEGKGVVADREKEFIAEPGMAFFIPAGESHWHGSTGEAFTHISIIGGISQTRKS